MRFKRTTNYNASSWVDLYTYSIGKGTQSNLGTWSQSNVSKDFKTTLTVAAFTANNSGTVSYEVVSGSNSAGCSFNGRTLSYTRDGTCKIRVRVTKSNYNDWTSNQVTITVNPISITGITWGSYGTLRVGGHANAPSVASTPTIASAGKAYTQSGLSSPGCTVNNAGRLTGVANGNGNCKVKLTLSKDGYNDAEHVYTLSVAKGNQGTPGTWSQTDVTRNFGAALTLAAFSYTGSGGTVSYEVKSDANTAECTIDSNRAVSFGNNGTCKIRVKVTKTYYNDWTSAWVTITVNPVAFPTAITWSNLSVSNKKVGESMALPRPTEAIVGDRVTFFESPNSNHCRVSGTRVHFERANGNCTFTAQIDRKGYDLGTSNIKMITVIRGDQVDITGWTNPYGSAPSLAADSFSTLSITGSPTPTSNGTAAVEYRDSDSDTGACSVATNGTVTAGSTAGTCNIDARYKVSTNYGASQ